MDRGLITIAEVINEEYVKKTYGTEEGNLYKPEPYSSREYLGADFRYNGTEHKEYAGIFDKTKTFRTTEEDKDRLIKILKNINETSDTEVIENNFIDFDKIIKMVAINKVLASRDVFTAQTLRNFYIYEENGKLDILTFDFDISLTDDYEKDYWRDDINEFDLKKSDKKIYSRIIEIIIDNKKYNRKYYQYVEETMKMLKDIEIDKIIDKKYEITKEAIKSNEKKIYPYNIYERGIKDLKRFLLKRANMQV